MEVDVPALGLCGVTDPNIECLQVQEGFVLQSSPEYFMKRLLASGSGDIYYLGKAYRSEEAGIRHSKEFTLLEWYRCGFDDHRLMAEVVELIAFLSGQTLACEKIAYAQLFERYTGLNPHRADCAILTEYAASRLEFDFTLHTKSDCLDLIFSHCIEPHLGQQLTIIYDYPACQAALAKLADNPNGDIVARRFEVFWKGLELANGYWELNDPQEQEGRFFNDIALRLAQGKEVKNFDSRLVEALHAGLPESAGVALGVDRLLMAICGASIINEVQSFNELD